MWCLNINDSAVSTKNINNKHLMNSANELKKQKDIIDYMSQAMWNTVPETCVKAIKACFFAIWPGLTERLVKKHYSRTPETEKEHVKTDRKT